MRNFDQAPFRTGVVSKVANFAIDLPDTSLAIQVSGTVSVQAGARRRVFAPGRILGNQAYFTASSRQIPSSRTSRSGRNLLCEQGIRIRDLRCTRTETVERGVDRP
jgi:DNA excision repair protein ERCC-3